MKTKRKQNEKPGAAVGTSARGKMPKITLFKEPIKLKTGGWVEQEFDAALECFGVRWLRVKDGMGGDGRREDWVADVPAVSVAVHDYHWNGDDFGPDHGSFVGAIKGESKSSMEYAIQRIKEKRAEITNLERGVAILRASLATAELREQFGMRDGRPTLLLGEKEAAR